MTKYLLLTVILSLFCSSYAGGQETEQDVNVYLYDFKPFSFRWTNKFKKADRVLSFRPSVETEIRPFKERKFKLSLSLIDSKGKVVFSKTQEIERLEADKKDLVVVVFYLEDMILFPQKPLSKPPGTKAFYKKRFHWSLSASAENPRISMEPRGKILSSSKTAALRTSTSGSVKKMADIK